MTILVIVVVGIIVLLTYGIVDSNTLTLVIVIPVALGALAYGIYEKVKRKKYPQTDSLSPQRPSQQTRRVNIRESTYIPRIGKAEDYFSLEKIKKRARHMFLSYSIVLFPGLAALITLAVFYSSIRSFLTWFFVAPDQILFMVASFLAIYTSLIGVMFMWNLWKYISAKSKMKLFSVASNQ